MSSGLTHDSQQYEPLLQDDDKFSSYDDDALERNYRRRRKASRRRIICVIIVFLILVLSVAATLFFVTDKLRNTDRSTEFPVSNTVLGKFKHAAIASDSAICSDIGKEILHDKGGSSVDAAIAMLICYGVVNPVSSGIGGGFFMTIYDTKTRKATIINAREAAPLKANTTMYHTPNDSRTGGLSIAVPGEIRGYQMAFQKFGKLNWKDLFTKSIELAKNGFKISEHLAEKMDSAKDNLFSDPDTRAIYTNPETGELLKEGDEIKFTNLGQTLEKIAQIGSEEFYTGELAKDIIKDLNEKGAIINETDLENYIAKEEEALTVTLKDGSTLYSPAPPSSGAILSFILNILDGYNMTPETLKNRKEKLTAYHRIIEAFKFAYAKRSDLGDREFVDVQKLVANLTSRAYADSTRKKIWDNATHSVPYYGPVFDHKLKTSTAHLSVLGNDGLAVAVTTTVNLLFGSGVTGNRTGILFNDEMDDFSSPNITNAFGLPPSPSNFIKPGKRPMSSMCPAVLVDKSNQVKMVVGAAGGSRITTSTAYVAARSLWFGDDIKQAIDARRLHDQLIPTLTYYEPDFPEFDIDGLHNLGHNTTLTGLGYSIVNGIVRHGDWIYANNDFRRPGGSSAGF